MKHALTRFRERRGLSMAELARMAETSRQTIHRIENGDQWPSRDLMAKLKEVTGGAVTADDFLPTEKPKLRRAADHQ